MHLDRNISCRIDDTVAERCIHRMLSAVYVFLSVVYPMRGIQGVGEVRKLTLDRARFMDEIVVTSRRNTTRPFPIHVCLSNRNCRRLRRQFRGLDPV